MGHIEKYNSATLKVQDILAELEEKGYMKIYESSTCSDRFPLLFNNPNGIHGVLHAKRVLLLSLTLSYLHNLNKSDTDLLVNASLYHDIGREHDGICFEHGRNSFKKMLDLELIHKEENEDFTVLRYVIENHCIHDDTALKNLDNYLIDDKERAVGLLKFFKDSDNLDRVRINDLDIKYLRSPVSVKLVPFANYLLKEIC